MDIKDSIIATKKGFEESFATGDFYNKQTQDEQHLNAILDFLPIESGMKILDLGTGSGYLSFAIARRYQNVSVVGLDIMEKALENNRGKAAKENVSNLSFVTYDGMDFPFADQEFDMVISRYALHHFPKIQESVSQVSRVLKSEGFFFISDPTPNENDDERFVDAYMQLKKDGHIKFYTVEEWKYICGNCGMQLKDSFDSSIRFPKKKDTAYGFEELLGKYGKEVIAGYELEIVGNEIYVTEQVNNLLFCKWDMEKFLTETKYVDYNDAEIQKKVKELFTDDMEPVEKVKTAYEYVRDHIPHSFDCSATVITAKASDVLKEKTGICHAKANLLAALLRSQGIPVGFCFEHITLANDDSIGYCVHAYNAVYVEKHWIYLDARGNKEGVNAQFSLEEPILAYPPRKEYDEYLFKGIYANSHGETMYMLEKAKSLQDIMDNIPEFVTEKPDIEVDEAMDRI